MHPAAQRAPVHVGLIFGSGTDQQPPAPCWPAALVSCSRSPEQLEPPSVACVGHLWLARPAEFGARLGARGIVRAVPVLRGRGGRCWAPPARLPGAQGCCSPAAELASSRFSQALQQRASPGAPSSASRMFLGALGRALACSVVGRGIPHGPVSEPSSSGPRRCPPVAACSCLAVVQCPEFPFRMIPGSATGPGSPGSRSKVLALPGRDLRPHRYRGITLTRACASPPCISGFSVVRHQLRSLGDASVGIGFVLDPLHGCVPGRD